MNIKLKIISIIVLIVIVGIGYSYLYYKESGAEAKEFVGTVESVKDSSIVVEGFYSVPDQPEVQIPNQKRRITVLFDQNTTFTKESIHLPSAEELKATDGYYDPSKLKRDKVQGSIDDFKEGGVSVVITSSTNVYGQPSFHAVEILYIEPVYPNN